MRTEKSEITLSANPTDFQDIVIVLTTKLKIRFTEEINDLDLRYWDFQYKGVGITLHQELYSGVSIFLQDPDQTQHFQLLKELEAEIQKHCKLNI